MKTKIRSKVLAILMSLAMASALMPIMASEAHAEEIAIDGLKYNLNDDGKAELVWCDNRNLTDIDIPGTVDYNEKTYTVTSIKPNAFASCKNLANVTIPNSVTTIDMGAFNGCSSLTTIEIPNSVTQIGMNAFNTSGLTSVTFEAGSSLTSVGYSAFENCGSLATIKIPNSVTDIGLNAFKNTGLTSVTFEAGSSLKSVGPSAFENCGSLTTIEIPKSVTEIGMNAFRNLGLKSVTFEAGSSLTSIIAYAFADCSSLTTITIPRGVTEIGTNAFGSCDSLNNVYYQGTETQWNEMSGRDANWAGGRDIKVVFLLEAPKGLTLKYNGKEQTGVPEGEGYTLSGTTSAKEVGSYQATATLDESYEWSDGTTAPKTISWKINKAAAKVTAPTGKTYTYNGKAQTGVAAGSKYTLSGTVKATKAGSYTAKAALKANANYTYTWPDGTTAVKTIKWKINKAANTLTVKGKTTKVKYKKLKKKAQKLDVTNVISFTKAGQGTKTYKLVSVKKGKKNFDKKISIDSKTGKVTIKKKLKKGTYNVKVNVKASGNVNYKASAWKAVTFKIKVK